MKVLATPRSFGKNNPELFDILRDAGLDVVRNDTGGILSADRMCEKLADCDGLIVGVDPVDATVLAAAPRLRAIAKYGVGLDNIDLAACEARGIKVSRTVGANSEAVADYALALMLGVARKVALIDRRCRERDWSKITGIDLYGKTVGIIGLGAIGKRVARRCGAGFGMTGTGLVVSAVIGIVTVLTGSGVASFTGLVPIAPQVAGSLGGDPAVLAMMMQLSSEFLRPLSPVAGVIIIVAGFAGVSPLTVVRRTWLPCLAGLAVALALTILLF